MPGGAGLGGFGTHEPTQWMGRIQHLHILAFPQQDGILLSPQGQVVSCDHIDVKDLVEMSLSQTQRGASQASQGCKSHLNTQREATGPPKAPGYKAPGRREEEAILVFHEVLERPSPPLLMEILSGVLDGPPLRDKGEPPGYWWSWSNVMVTMLATQGCAPYLLCPSSHCSTPTSPPSPCPPSRPHTPLPTLPYPSPVHVPRPGSLHPLTLRTNPGRWRRGVSGHAGGMQTASWTPHHCQLQAPAAWLGDTERMMPPEGLASHAPSSWVCRVCRCGGSPALWAWSQPPLDLAPQPAALTLSDLG